MKKRRPLTFNQYARVGRAFALATILVANAGCTARKEQTAVEKPIPEVQVSRAVSQFLQRRLILPAEILSYQWVDIYPKVTGFIQWIGVDRGSVVHQGEVLVKLTAPELEAQTRAAEATQLQANADVQQAYRQELRIQSQTLKDEAKYRADARTYSRLAEAAQTPGAIAQNEVDIARDAAAADLQQVNADKHDIQAARAQVQSNKDRVKAAIEQLHNLQVMQSYLTITAPYDGIITQRNMHEGSLAYPPSGPSSYLPMLEIKQLSPLRIVVAVPEEAAADVRLGMPVRFSVSAYPGRTFVGTVARIAHSLEQKTRTMPVELNFPNTHWEISPGMFAQAYWMQTRSYKTLFVPTSSVVRSLKTPFVICVRNGVAERVPVLQGQTMDDYEEVFGNLCDKDVVVTPGSDTLDSGTKVKATLVQSQLTQRGSKMY